MEDDSPHAQCAALLGPSCLRPLQRIFAKSFFSWLVSQQLAFDVDLTCLVAGLLRNVSVMLPNLSSDPQFPSGPPDERRKNLRFRLAFTAAVRTPFFDEAWLTCKTSSVGVKGACLETAVALPLETCIDYVVTFPAELTHTPSPLRVKFSGQVLRVDSMGEEHEAYRVAVSNTKYRFVRDAEGEFSDAAQADSPDASQAEPQSAV